MVPSPGTVQRWLDWPLQVCSWARLPWPGWMHLPPMPTSGPALICRPAGLVVATGGSGEADSDGNRTGGGFAIDPAPVAVDPGPGVWVAATADGLFGTPAALVGPDVGTVPRPGAVVAPWNRSGVFGAPFPA